jgi:hypothetical protein
MPHVPLPDSDSREESLEKRSERVFDRLRTALPELLDRALHEHAAAAAIIDSHG